MKFRQHRGGLAESMETVVELQDFDALVKFLAEKLSPFGVEVTPELVKAGWYCFDKRIGWDTWMITLDGAAVGFTDGDPMKRFLGEAKRKSEGEETAFDEGVAFGNYVPRGAGQTMRGEDLANVWLSDTLNRWFVVRDKMCSYDIDDPAAAVWTLSLIPGEPGWSTDSGTNGYGLLYAHALALADAANRS